MHVISTVATDVLVPKHQAISIHSAEWIFMDIVFGSASQKNKQMLHSQWTTWEMKITFW